jgi:hypothetical protein
MTKKEIKAKDLIWKERIKKRDKECIVNDKCRGPLAADHIFSRKYHATRWLATNGVLLCQRHHIFWKRQEPVLWYWAVEKKVGKKRLKYLRKKITT